MNNKFNKILAIVLCLVMAVGSVAAVMEGAPAESPAPAEAPVTTEAPVETAVPTVPPAEETEAPVEESPVPTEAPAPSSLDEPEAPVCTCEATDEEKAAEGFAHAEGCPLYVPVCTCEGTEEEKAAEGFVHAEGCDFYEAPVDPNAELYEKLMATTTAEELEAILNSLSEEQLSGIVGSCSEEELQALEAHIILLLPPSGNMEALNVISVSRVAPFVQLVLPASGSVKKNAAARNLFRAPAPRSVSTSNLPTEEGHEGLFLNKNVTDNGDGTYTITLESYTTGDVVSETVSVPADIVLVLDVSGSMAEYITVGSKGDTSELDTIYGATAGTYEYNSLLDIWVEVRFHNGSWQYNGLGGWKDLSQSSFGTQKIRISKINALKIAVNRFIDQVYNKAVEDNVDHRIALVKYAGNKTDSIGNDVYGSYDYNYSQIVNGLVSVTSAAGTLKTNLASLSEGGATAADYGMQHAQTIINGIDSSRVSNKVVVMFTDGEPNHENGFDNSVANSTISASKSIKAAGASVYTIGVFEGANDTVPMTGADQSNTYMHYVSSNFKNAESMSNGGAATYPSDGSSYYKAASNASDISSIFQQISNNISSPTVSLGTDTVLKDVVSPYFTVPADASDINLYTEDYTGSAFDGTRVAATGVSAAIDPATNTVSVTGFDYNKYFVSSKEHDGTYGKKLIVEFTVPSKSDFIGGNCVETNVGTSGIFKYDGTNVGYFVVPNVDVPINYDFNTKDQTIYLGEKADLKALIQSMTPATDGMNNAYVNISYTVKDPAGNVVGTMTIPAGQTSGEWTWTPNSNPELENDTTYTISCVVTPIYEGTVQAKTIDKDATVFVKTCTLTITKSGATDGNNEGFIFNVTADNGKNFTVSVKDNGTVKIVGLPVGTYTVAEQAAWSWRYALDSYTPAATVTLNKDNENGTVTVKNGAGKPYLLDGSDYKQNNSALYQAPAAK